MNGWIILDKPLGLGSTQAVGAVKRVCREAGLGKVKVGHGGTLDPLATGVLPIALGEATKLCGRMLDASKIYDFTIRFGVQTDGLDAEGEVVATSDVRPTLAEVEAVLPRFTGPIEQVPPAYSAIKIDGERAYDRARKGEAVEMKARAVTVYSLEILPTCGEVAARSADGGGSRPEAPAETALPLHHPADGPPPRAGEDLSEITLTAHVSKGTYIRSLARDIALALGTVGHVTMLRRTRAGPFTAQQAISLDKLNAFGQGAAQSDFILPLEAGLVDIPALDLSPEAAGAIRQGRVWTGVATDDGLYWGRDGENRPIALIEALAGTLKVVRGFNL
ncbi:MULTISPECIES: tRNA pseudouridine(55) synthase TruB [unclassified Sphingopyxis]|uniref:tRNA pseudouridine(55) synthase TruB n=1 Tax=unclassified Sphingopyxis TaxID=2614943 RepID=UPI00073602ED|nr:MULTISPECIES: tRNA pseudouridine(55) synthase TruB [unclassified Sphingopyxis]KTE44204.1 pseudouridine synthase [Sphingopyxis sp. HIX]KTE85854.1 pseudouridine synthase [Sphingopyxis sp. HXXIV]